MDETSLESAIRNEAALAILAVTQKEDAEVKRLDDAYAAEIEEFKNRITAETDARIRQESSKVINRADLDLKKHQLRSVEAFISRIVEEAVKTIRGNPRYKRFLIDAACDAVSRIPAGTEVRLMSEDLAFEEEIRECLRAAGGNRDIAVMGDKTIKWGGCIVADVPGGRIFDSTIERIYFRKSPAIRREVMRLLDNSFGNSA